MRFKAIFIAAVFAAAVGPQTASAQEDHRPNLIVPSGMSASIGGGVMGFTDDTMTDFTSAGGAWEARFIFGTREYLGLEAAYSGTAIGVDAIGLDSNAVLVSTGLEALARANLLKGDVQPYAVAGVGWRRYDLTNADFNNSSVTEEDNVFEVPLGVGVAYRYKGLVLDARGLFRVALEEDLIATAAGQDSAKLHTIEASARIGWEF